MENVKRPENKLRDTFDNIGKAERGRRKRAAVSLIP